jgi:hypothetical protein
MKARGWYVDKYSVGVCKVSSRLADVDDPLCASFKTRVLPPEDMPTL